MKIAVCGIACLLLAGCSTSPSDSRMKRVADTGHSLILTDDKGNHYTAVHSEGDGWTLRATLDDKSEP